jgi:DNA-binding NarL/FixJ family response regulator
VIRIIVVDDHPLVRRGIREMVAAQADLEVVGEAATAAEVPALLAKQSCDVLLLDLSLPDGSGLEVLKELRRGFPQLRVLVVSTHDPLQYGVRSIRAGAAGYVSKNDPENEIVPAIRAVARTGRYISPRLAEALADFAMLGGGADATRGLSDRELEVLRRLAQGSTISDIAADLSLSVKTVSTYRTRILDKLGLRTTNDLVRYAVERRLFD